MIGGYPKWVPALPEQVPVQISRLQDTSLNTLTERVGAILETILGTVNGGGGEILAVTQFARDSYYHAVIYWRAK